MIYKIGVLFHAEKSPFSPFFLYMKFCIKWKNKWESFIGLYLFVYVIA